MVVDSLVASIESLGKGIVVFVNYGITILVIMFIIELARGLMLLFGGGKDSSGTGKGKKTWESIKKGFRNKFPWAATASTKARRAHKAEINEYIMEEKEEKDLDSLKYYIQKDILTELEAVASRGRFDETEKANLVAAIDKFAEKSKDVKNNFNKLGNRTSRTDRRLDNLFAYFKKQGIVVPERVKKLEEHILVLHQQTKDDIAKAEELYQKIIKSPSMKALVSITPAIFARRVYEITNASVPFKSSHLNNLIKGFRDEKFLLEDAYKRQVEAKKDMEGIIAETRDLY